VLNGLAAVTPPQFRRTDSRPIVSSTPMNSPPPSLTRHFLSGDAAARYLRGRPFVHPVIVERIQRITERERFGAVLDVGCGTGQSSRAVAAVATEVIGVDLSAEMLGFARREGPIPYLRGRAEALPVASGAFELVTTGLAFHWFDQPRFLAESHRVLKPGGWLAIYNTAFGGRVRDCPAVEPWIRGTYLVRYPSPPRRAAAASVSAGIDAAGFEVVASDAFSHPVPLSATQLVEFLMSQSNITAAIEAGPEGPDEIAAGLESALRERMGSTTGEVEFQSTVQVLRREFANVAG